MTTREFAKAAGRRFFVQWTQSGKIERLSYMNGNIYAEDIITGKKHPIYNWKKRKEYFCRIVDRKEHVRLGDLI